MAQWPCLIDSGFQKALENVDVAQRHQSHDSIYTVLLPFFISSTRDSLSSQWNVSHENPMEGDRVMETFLTLQWEFGSQHSGWWLAENPKSFSFLTSQGGSWGCQSQCLYTLPALDWMAHSPFLTGLQRNRPRSPDNAVITTTHPFCRLAKFRSTGHREQKKSHSTWSSETRRYGGLFLSPAVWAELKTDKSEVKTPLEGGRCKLSFMWLGET